MNTSVFRRRTTGWLAAAVLFAPAVCQSAALTVRGTVLDPAGASIPGAQVAALNRLGVVSETASDTSGRFELRIPDAAGLSLRVTAAGFATQTVAIAAAEGSLTIRLEIAPQLDVVRVVGSPIDVPVSEQGESVSVISGTELRERNEAQTLELLRFLPGLAVSQTGSPGGTSALFIRGGNSNFNLVQIDGVPVNSFGGAFDFTHIPTDWLERVEVIRGPQSAVYGAYANSGVISLVTRSAEDAPALDLLAEGGSHRERRFALGGSGMLRGFGIAAFASRLDGNGPVANSDYRNENLALHVTRGFGAQFLSLSGNFNSNETGEPGPWGSNPLGLYTGIDTFSRARNNFSDYSAHYQADVSARVRQELFAGFFLNNNFYRGPGFDGFNKDLRGFAESRTVVSVTSGYTAAFGVSAAREEVKNSILTDDSFRPFLLRRNEEGIYWDNQFRFRGRLFWNAGLRADLFQTPAVPANAGFGRPAFPANDIARLNPKVSAAWVARSERDSNFGSTRLHASFATGIRPPAGLDLAFTDNPALKPERTRSFEAGLEQRLLRNRLALDATYFHNRFSNLIVSLGGDLAKLSSYRSDNLSNARAQGLEVSARLRPASWVSVMGSYTYLNTEILSLNGASGVAPAYFAVGQELIRRPAHSGGFVSTFLYRRVSVNVTGYLRGSVLDVEPNYGASAGLFRNPGFADLGVNVNVRVAPGVSVYGNLRNALNRRYEEAYGYPSPLLNFVSGIKWTVARKK